MNVDVGESWEKILRAELSSVRFKKLAKQVDELYFKSDCLPQKEQIFKAFQGCEFKDLKVVILGQDPYPTVGHPNGMCFSVSKEIKPLPKSLQNIFKCLRNDLGIDLPDNGCLKRWSEQGVLLLNSVLTVEAGNANSHQSIGWQSFTDEVIRQVSLNQNDIVFMLWGNQAQKKEVLIDQNKHLVLKSVHPSPLSAYRGFMDCKHFSKANIYLNKNATKSINW
jgi:uracil-DNA glycosylase